MFARQRAPGLWTFDTPVTSAEFEYFDASISNAIDGDQGGVYSLQDDLIIGGAPGVGIELDLQLDTADVAMHGTLQVDDTALLNGQAFFSDDATFSGPNFNLNSAIMSFGDSSADLFTFNAHGTFQADVNFNSDVFFNDDAHVAGEIFANDFSASGFFNADGNCFLGSATGFVEFLGNVTARTPITFADSGKVKWRTETIAAAGNQSVLAAEVDTVFVPNGVMTAGNILTINDTGAEDGMRIEFSTTETTNTITVTTPAALSRPLKNASGFYQTVAYQRVAGVWQIADLGLVP